MPADRPTTESLNPRSDALDTMSALEIVTLMNEEDASVPSSIGPALPAIAAFVEAVTERLRDGGRLFYAGAGTSGRLALIDAVECVPTFSVPPELVTPIMAGGQPAITRSVEGAEDDTELARHDIEAAGVGAGDALVGVAASGTTPYVIAAIETARGLGALTAGMTNNADTPVLHAAHHAIVAVTGPEVLSGSTRLKAGTAQKLMLNMISTAAMVRLGKVHGNRMIDVAVTNAKLRQRAEGIVADLVGCEPGVASDLLDAADEEVKTAVLMGLTGLDATAARARLTAARGYLRAALDG
jgi:N-acetylmuramic acid 6-phosphate etherase